MTLYDCVIIGGGPAGLSAAIYLGRALRSTVVLDAGHGRSGMGHVNENYLGFPEGITSTELRERGITQAERFGAAIEPCTAFSASRTEEGFQVSTNRGVFTGKTLLLATGVTDIWPDIPDIENYIGKQVFWCLTCDGHRACEKRIVCIGNKDTCAVSTLRLLCYSSSIAFVTDPERTELSDEKLVDLEDRKIQVVRKKPSTLQVNSDGNISAVGFPDGTSIPCDIIFSFLGVRPNTEIAISLDAEVDSEGYIVVGPDGKSSIPGFFAAGDLIQKYSQEVVAAVHSGAEAAEKINFLLYDPPQKG